MSLGHQTMYKNNSHTWEREREREKHNTEDYYTQLAESIRFVWIARHTACRGTLAQSHTTPLATPQT